MFDTVRGRPKRSTDDSELLWFQRRKIRRQVLDALAPLAADDEPLAAALASVRQAERWFRRSAWLAVGITVGVIAMLDVTYQRKFG